MPRLLLGSFLGLILFGTIGLKVLPGLYTGPGLGWIDALFTATSAVCVTGLIVVDTATYFTPWGQAFLLLLIQLGGLGILTFTTLVILAVGGRISLHHEAVTATHADVSEDVDFRSLVRNVVIFTFLLEAIGAVLLFGAFAPRFPTPPPPGTPSSRPSARSATPASRRSPTRSWGSRRRRWSRGS